MGAVPSLVTRAIHWTAAPGAATAGPTGLATIDLLVTRTVTACRTSWDPKSVDPVTRRVAVYSPSWRHDTGQVDT